MSTTGTLKSMQLVLWHKTITLKQAISVETNYVQAFYSIRCNKQENSRHLEILVFPANLTLSSLATS